MIRSKSPLLLAALAILTLCSCGGGSGGASARSTPLTFYVDSAGGNDANNGTSQATPWASIGKVNGTALIPGDSVLFAQGGKWREELDIAYSGSAATPIVYGAYGSGAAQPIISGSDVVTAWTLYDPSNSIYFTSLSTWDFVPGVTVQDGMPLHLVSWAGSIAATQGLLVAGTFTVDPATKTVYVRTTDGQSPTTHTMEVARRLYTAHVAATTPNQTSFVTLQGLTFEQAAFHCVFVDSGISIRVTGSTLRTCGGIVISAAVTPPLLAGNGIEWSGPTRDSSLENSTVSNILDSCASPQLYNNDSMLSNISITGNTLSGCGKSGVEVSILGPSSGQFNTNTFISGVTIQSNTITASGTGWSGNRDGAGVEVFNNDGSPTSVITGVVIQANTVQTNLGNGIDLRSYSGTTTVQQNRVSANGGDGVAVIDGLATTTTGVNLYANLIYDNVRHGLEYNVTPAAQPFQIYNNVFVDNGSDSTATFNLTLTSVGSPAASQMFNNICYSVDSVCLYDPGSAVRGTNFDNDIFYRASGPVALVSSSFQAYSLGQFAQFKADTNSHAAGFFADPKFASLAAPDFHLSAGSVGLSAGRAISGLTVDFAGNPFGTPPDIGAYQH